LELHPLIIDDTEVEKTDLCTPFFGRSSQESFKSKDSTSLKKKPGENRNRMLALSLITVNQFNSEAYIDSGLNQNNGASQPE